MKYDLRKIMKRAWEITRKVKNTFAQALMMAWKIAKFEVNFLNKEGGIKDNGFVGEMTFNIWSSYGKVRAYFKTNWESKYQNDKSRFVELI